MTAEKPYKVLVFGLDGATFDLMLPWIAEGRLPVLGRLVRGGAWGRLRSTVPPITPCAWSSFMTGKNPGKHGLFYFAQPAPNSYRLQFTNASFRHAESLWGYLSRLGRRVGVVNVPMTYPPEPVNGYLISGLDTPDTRSRFTHPESLREELQGQALAYRLDLCYLGNMRTNAQRDRRLEELKEIETIRSRALQFLARKYPSDFTMIVHTATDTVQHHFWHYMDPGHDKHDPANADRYRHAIRDVYVHLDGLLGEALEACGEDTVVMLMSDHGFGPTTNVRVRLNQALEQAGLLAFRRQGPAGRAARSGLGALSRLLRATLSPGAKKFLARALPRLRVWGEAAGAVGLDWGKTTAFTNEAFRPPSVWLNRQDRFPQGTVTPEGLEGALRATEQALLKLRDPGNGKPLVSHVYRSRDEYQGPYAASAPDLIPSWWEDGFLQEQSVPGGPQGKVVERSQSPIQGGVEFSGSHRLDGVFAVAGGPARRGLEFSGARIVDVAPTVLYLMGLPIPGDMDGRPLLEALDPDFVAAHPPRFEQGAGAGQPPPAPEEAFSEQEAQMIEARLKSLGYVE
jgi:predicted AlkP superfamily phosphohydrolase/phosphomutase